MAKKPPIVWHLDTDDINRVSNSPDDRLTQIRDLMIAFEAEQEDPNLDKKKPLKKLLEDIYAICQQTTETTD